MRMPDTTVLIKRHSFSGYEIDKMELDLINIVVNLGDVGNGKILYK